mmetsp:Transcript_43214/g.108186  ORF Transcript_43214/g.108186 Transcript_43214/m.108186 type:complete len:226 (+) Transcript_43214:356-1033(+)
MEHIHVRLLQHQPLHGPCGCRVLPRHRSVPLPPGGVGRGARPLRLLLQHLRRGLPLPLADLSLHGHLRLPQPRGARPGQRRPHRRARHDGQAEGPGRAHQARQCALCRPHCQGSPDVPLRAVRLGVDAGDRPHVRAVLAGGVLWLGVSEVCSEVGGWDQGRRLGADVLHRVLPARAEASGSHHCLVRVQAGVHKGRSEHARRAAHRQRGAWGVAHCRRRRLRERQ